MKCFVMRSCPDWQKHNTETMCCLEEGKHPFYYWAATVEWHHAASRCRTLFNQTRRISFYISVGFLLRGWFAGKSNQVHPVHTFSQISITGIPNVWQLTLFTKFAVVPIYPVCTSPAVSTDPESVTASLMWSAQLDFARNLSCFND